MSSNLIGQIILGRYRVDAFIEAGGMGVVYRIWDLTRSVSLAMKVLHEDLSEDPSVWKMFQREAEALSQLTHPHIVPFYGLFQTEAFSFFLEHFVDGESLKSRLQKTKGLPLPVSEALIYLKTLSSALGYAHYYGIIHCDIKPGNVLIDHGGNIFLTDFGIARSANSTTTTMAGAGTPAYMAPEQIRGESVTPSADVYALGILLYELLTGRRPFLGNEPESEPFGPSTDQRIYFAQINLNAAAPNLLNPNVPPALAQVMMKALEKNASARFASTQELFLAACQAAGVRPETVPDRLPTARSMEADVRGQPAATQVFEHYAQPVYTPPSTLPFLPSDLPAAPEKKKPHLPAVLAVAGLSMMALAAIIVIVVMRFNPSGGVPIVAGERQERATESVMEQPTATKAIAAERIENPPPVTKPTKAAARIDPTATRAPTNTTAPSLAPSRTPYPEAEEFLAPLYSPISGCAPSHIHKGDWTMITFGGGHNAIRSTPDTHPTDNKIGFAEEGELIQVIDGPECNYGWLLWKVRTAAGLEGWTPETNGKEFWIEPYPAWDACRGSQKSLLHKGDMAQVNLFPPVSNRVRSGPSTTAEHIASIDPGVKLNIIDGPHCGEGLVWWKIRAGSTTGWTAEGKGDTYWLVPVSEPRR